MTSSRPYSSRPDGTATSANASIAGAPKHKRLYQILAGQLFDSVNRTIVQNQVITIDRDTGVILDVSAQSDGKSVGKILADLGWKITSNGLAEKGDQLRFLDVARINLSNLILLPGFVDVHVHCKSYLTLILAYFLTTVHTTGLASLSTPLFGDAMGGPSDEREPGGADCACNGACS